MANGQMVAKSTSAEVMGFRVAGLGLWLDARGTGLRLIAPACHIKFLQAQTSEVCETEVSGDLVLRVRDGPPPNPKGGETLLCRSEIWELWLDEAGHYVFVAPRQSPPRRIVVDSGFTAGEVFGDFPSTNGDGVYPPQGLDIRVFANWLASYGDLILHASGVALEGKGYCFVGPAGAGKSTLAASLMPASRGAAGAATTHAATAADAATTNDGGTGGAAVLGEDQVILRYLQDRFWIYGTPWHENPAMCAPLGVPLEKVFFLNRTAASGVQPLGPVDGVARLLQTAFVPYYRPTAVAAILERLALLAERLPFYTLSYQLGADVIGLIQDA